jgi:tRNA(Ile)-lysidine synthase
MKILLPSTDHYVVSLSGGVDSMVLCTFLLNGSKNVSAIHFNHGTAGAQRYEDLVATFCEENGVSLNIYDYNGAPSEKNWANWRKLILRTYVNDGGTVVTAHHADDKIESLLMGRDLAYCANGIYRPLINVTKKQIIKYALKKNVQWIEDLTNLDSTVSRRNKIRNELIPLMKACGVNPQNLVKNGEAACPHG